MNDKRKDCESSETSLLYKVGSAGFAFFMWGGWAFYINMENGFKRGLISGLAQGIASLLITLFLIRMVTFIFHTLSIKTFRIILPGLLTVSFTGSCLAIMHYLIETPNIIYTIAPALSVALSFCFFTAFKLSKDIDYIKDEVV